MSDYEKFVLRGEAAFHASLVFTVNMVIAIIISPLALLGYIMSRFDRK